MDVKKKEKKNGVQGDLAHLSRLEQVIQAMERPTTVTEVRRLIGMVQYYRDLWPKQSHILEAFTLMRVIINSVW